MSSKGRKGRGGKAGASTPSTKRQRTPSDEIESEEIEVDPDLFMDTLLACLTKKPSLLDKFLDNLLEAPAIQDKITEKVLGSLDSNTMKDTSVDSESLSEPGSKTEKPGVAKSLIGCLQELTNVVQELKAELKSSNQKCDDLEQYSRRNNIIISGVPEDAELSTEDQAIEVLNDYLTPKIYYGEVDRCHRIYRNTKNPADKRPSDIIVKFVSYRTKARILTKDPMEKLRADNDTKPEKDRIYIREDLTKKRSGVLFKTRQLKKAGLVKDAFTRDGTIFVRMVAKKPAQKDITVRLTSEDDLKSFCKKFKLEVDEDCVPLSKSVTKTSVVGPAVASTSKAGMPPMAIHKSQSLVSGSLNTTLNAEATSFTPMKSSNAKEHSDKCI